MHLPRNLEEWSPLELIGFMSVMQMTRQQMADILAIKSVSTVSRWLSGQTIPTKERIAQLRAIIAFHTLLQQQERIVRSRGS
jgi:transcriptional regulator with XRE-family HTH domain